jgi:DNA-binding transcriptional LysR family regulator
MPLLDLNKISSVSRQRGRATCVTGTGPALGRPQGRAVRGYFVAVCEERHVGRAAARLHMTQPPLSRAVRQLETEPGTVLLRRSATGVMPTAAGNALYKEARTLLEQADGLRSRVAAAAGPSTLTIGTLADSAEQVGTRLAAAFRRRKPRGPHPGGRLHGPDDGPASRSRRGRPHPGPVRRHRVPRRRAALRPGRRDPVHRRAARQPRRAYTCATSPTAAGSGSPTARIRAGAPTGAAPPTPASVAMDRSSATPTSACRPCCGTTASGWPRSPTRCPPGLTAVPLADMPPSRLVVAWNSDDPNPLVRSFAQIAAALSRPRAGSQ